MNEKKAAKDTARFAEMQQGLEGGQRYAGSTGSNQVTVKASHDGPTTGVP